MVDIKEGDEPGNMVGGSSIMLLRLIDNCADADENGAPLMLRAKVAHRREQGPHDCAAVDGIGQSGCRLHGIS